DEYDPSCCCSGDDGTTGDCVNCSDCGTADGSTADEHLVDLHLVDLHLVDLHLVDLHLVHLHLVDLHLVDLHLVDGCSGATKKRADSLSPGGAMTEAVGRAWRGGLARPGGVQRWWRGLAGEVSQPVSQSPGRGGLVTGASLVG